jgi:hypothetical protein
MQPGGPIRQPYAGVNFIPPRDYEFGYWRYLHKERRCPAYSMSELHPANIQCEASEENIVNSFQKEYITHRKQTE